MSMVIDNDVWTLTFPLAKIDGEIEFSFHQDPHVDELVGALAIIEEATDEFVERYGRTITLGHGGGPFDEHGTGKQARQEGHCCATLVAEALGLLEDPAWERLIRYAYFTDVGEPMGGGRPTSFEIRSPFDLTNLVKLTWRDKVTVLSKPTDEQRCDTVLDFLRYLQLFLWEQREFLAAQDEIFCMGRIVVIDRTGKKPLRVLFVKSDNYKINAAGRAKGADVVMQHKSTGHSNVYTANTSKVDLTDFVVSLHVSEMKLAGVDRIPDWEKLRQDGMPAGSCWYFASMHQQVHNGTEHHDVPPSKIPLEEREALLLEALDLNYFEPSRADECRGGHCWHSLKTTPCPLHERGLQRCRQIRYEMKKQATEATSS